MSLPAIVFPSFEEEKDFIISNFVDQESPAVENGIDVFELPFGNIPRGERIGRIADWTGLSADNLQQRGGQRRATAITNTLQKAEEEIEGWSLSLASANVVSSGGRRSVAARPLRGALPSIGATSGSRQFSQKDSQTTQRRFSSWSNRPSNRIREPSIKVAQDWKLIEEIEFSRLSKLQINVEEPEVLASYGSVKVYDKSFDKLKVKAEKSFSDEPESLQAHVSASEDAFIQEALSNNAATIYTTDVVAGLLMACQRTILPWDIIVKRRGQSVLFDVRKDSNVALVTVNENAADNAPEDGSNGINSTMNLGIEATKVNECLGDFLGRSQEIKKFDHEADSKVGSCYRYTKLNLGENYALVLRSTINNCMSASDNVVLSKAFLEYESGSMDWRQKLDGSRGAVLAHEMKNNGAILSRWIYQAILSGSSALKLAYVSRLNFKNPNKHVILGVQEYDPFDLATQMNLNVPNGFGVIRAIADLCLALPDNTDYALVRDANKPVLRLYSTPTA